MRKKILYFSFIAIFCLGAKCKKDSILYTRYPFYFHNGSNKAVISILGFKSLVKPYPDTMFTSTRSPFNTTGGGIIPNETVLLYDAAISWDILLKDLPNDTISLYVFNLDTLNFYPWDTIRSRYLILQRYDLSLKDLENRKFEIEYPYDPSRGKLKVWKP